VMNALGIKQTVNPEFDSAVMFAEKIVMEGVNDIYPLSREIKIAEVPVPDALAGRKLESPKVPDKEDLEIIAIKRPSITLQNGNEETCKILYPRQLPEKFVLQATDILVIMGNKDDILDFIQGK
jgi:Trk K+ transport system NAD-binding subunit